MLRFPCKTPVTSFALINEKSTAIASLHTLHATCNPILRISSYLSPTHSAPQVVPNTVSIAKEEACEARVITEATHPYRITYASQSWCDLFGYEPAKVIGQTCKILQGEETEMDRIEEIMTGVKFGRAGSTVLTNYNSDGEKMTISLRTYPLYTEVALTHYLGEYFYLHLSLLV
jgi:PAS domain S-box-containing protein